MLPFKRRSSWDEKQSKCWWFFSLHNYFITLEDSCCITRSFLFHFSSTSSHSYYILGLMYAYIIMYTNKLVSPPLFKFAAKKVFLWILFFEFSHEKRFNWRNVSSKAWSKQILFKQCRLHVYIASNLSVNIHHII